MNILVIGATSGIGRELAIDYARDNHTVFAIGRNQVALDELLQYRIISIKADITLLDSVSEAAKQIQSIISPIDIMILSAGTCEYVDIDNFSHQPFQEVMSINFFGMVNCLECFLPLLRKSSSPHIVGIASMAFYLPLSRTEAYGASKAAVNYLLESLSIDLAKDNFSVTVVNPGFVETPLTKRNDFPMPFLMTTKDASKVIIQGIKKRRAEICFPKKLTIPMKILHLFPRSWLRKMGLIFRKTKK